MQRNTKPYAILLNFNFISFIIGFSLALLFLGNRHGRVTRMLPRFTTINRPACSFFRDCLECQGTRYLMDALRYMHVTLYASNVQCFYLV